MRFKTLHAIGLLGAAINVVGFINTYVASAIV